MGQIKKIDKKKEVSTPLLNKRFTVELCENVHIHYRNLRMEFPKEEFLLLLRKLKSIDEKEVENFNYSPIAFKGLINDLDLPNDTEWNNRLQVEEQVNGQYHIHYKNLRLEFTGSQWRDMTK